MTVCVPKDSHRFRYAGPEENTEDPSRYKPHGLHTVILGEILPKLGTCVDDPDREPRYRIVSKLGFGAFSTVWLARDHIGERYISLKICQGSGTPTQSEEVTLLSELQSSRQEKAGLDSIVKLLDAFVIQGPNGFHSCLVTEVISPLSDVDTRVRCTATSLYQMIEGFAFLHEQGISHGDPHLGNIGIALPQLEQFDEEEITNYLYPEIVPVVPRHGVPLDSSTPAYLTSSVNIADFLRSVESFPTKEEISIKILDFGRAHKSGNVPVHLPGAVPLMCRPPEVVAHDRFGNNATSLWSSSADLWAMGCIMYQIMSTGQLIDTWGAIDDVLFRAVELGGPPPDTWPDIWVKSADGIKSIKRLRDATPRDLAWAKREAAGRCSQTKERLLFIELIKRVIVTNPNKRMSARELLDDPFFATDTTQGGVSLVAVAPAGPLDYIDQLAVA